MTSYEAQLLELIASTPWLLEVVRAVRDAGPPGAYVAAGAVRNAVWDSLHGRLPRKPARDVDVAYFDRAAHDIDWEGRLSASASEYVWEVTNQAEVHVWQSADYGRVVTPYASLAAALESWPETATSVGVRLSPLGKIEIIAPFGLTDLFELRVRPSPGLLDPNAYWTRVRGKAWKREWPKLDVWGRFEYESP